MLSREITYVLQGIPEYLKIYSYNTTCSYIPHFNLGHHFYRTWKQFTWGLTSFKIEKQPNWQHISFFHYLELWHFQDYLKSLLIHRGLFFSYEQWVRTTIAASYDACTIIFVLPVFLSSSVFLTSRLKKRKLFNGNSVILWVTSYSVEEMDIQKSGTSKVFSMKTFDHR